MIHPWGVRAGSWRGPRRHGPRWRALASRDNQPMLFELERVTIERDSNTVLQEVTASLRRSPPHRRRPRRQSRRRCCRRGVETAPAATGQSQPQTASTSDADAVPVSPPRIQAAEAIAILLGDPAAGARVVDDSIRKRRLHAFLFDCTAGRPCSVTNASSDVLAFDQMAALSKELVDLIGKARISREWFDLRLIQAIHDYGANLSQATEVWLAHDKSVTPAEAQLARIGEQVAQRLARFDLFDLPDDTQNYFLDLMASYYGHAAADLELCAKTRALRLSSSERSSINWESCTTHSRRVIFFRSITPTSSRARSRPTTRRSPRRRPSALSATSCAPGRGGCRRPEGDRPVQGSRRRRRGRRAGQGSYEAVAAAHRLCREVASSLAMPPIR